VKSRKYPRPRWAVASAAVACTFATATWSPPARAATDPPPKEGEKSEPTKPAKAAPLGFGVLGGVGFPRPLSVEGLIKIDGMVLLGAEYSALPDSTFATVHVSLWAVAADARFFPGRGPFFVGLRAGRQHFTAGGSLTISGVGSYSGSYSGSESADTTFLNPQLGFLWSLGPLAFGIDAGVQIPLSTSTSVSMPGGVPMPQAVLDVSRIVGSDVLPTIDLLRLGIVL
jgi:hypothetical protein